MDLFWPRGLAMQSVLTSLGIINAMNHAQVNDTLNGTIITEAFSAFNLSTFLRSPLSTLVTLAGGGEPSTLFTRFVQFGALGSVLQWLGFSQWITWGYYALYEYVIGRFVLRVYFDGDETPYLCVNQHHHSNAAIKTCAYPTCS